MKKIISLFALLFLITISFIGCGKKDSKTGAGIQTDKLESVSVGNEKFSLRYKFEKGDKFSYKLTTQINTQETIKADSTTKSNVDQNLSYVFDFEVVEVDEEHIADLSIKVTSIDLAATFNGKKITYKGGGNLTPDDKLKFMEYETIYNTPYRARVTSKGEVLEVSRLDKMVDKMNNMSPRKQILSTEQKAAYAKQLGEQALKPITQMVFRDQPEQAVRKDTTWEKRIPQQLGTLTVINIARFKVLDFVKIGSDKAAKMSADLSITFSGSKEGSENGVKYNFGDPEISGTGQIFFNIDSGKLVKADTKTTSMVSVTMEGKDSLKKTKKTTRTTNSVNRTLVELL